MPTAATLRESLLHDHGEIDRALGALVRGYETGDHDVARQAFHEFEARLVEHMAFEEQHLLPAFARFDATEAQWIADDHRAIRTSLDELGVGTDLHLTRLPAIRELAPRLRAHARREDALLYRWADEQTWLANRDLFTPSPP